MADAKTTIGQLLSNAGIQVGGCAPHDIEVHDERFYDRVLADRELGLGESYQEGWWDANRLDEFLGVVVANDLGSLLRPSTTVAIAAARAKLVNRQTLRHSARNASSHYDIGNDLYERMLDTRMIYSCGYWPEGIADLDAAQVAKLDLICRKLRFEPGMRVLDIGCGWGGFAQFAAEQFGVEVVGISLAQEQIKVAKARTMHLNVDIRLEDYRTMTGEFDRIVSIGMLEHVGPKNYGAFFEVCDRLLTEDGAMLHHTIGGLDSRTRTDMWFDKYIFPGGVLPSMAQICSASERNWVIEDVHNFGPDYDTTLMHWYRNISSEWDNLSDYDRFFQRTWEYYLLASAAAFRVRSLQLWQLVFRRSRRPASRYLALR